MASLDKLRSELGPFAQGKSDESLLQLLADSTGRHVNDVADQYSFNPARVFAFVSSLMPMQMVGGMKGLGLERNGELIAGVLYEGYNGHNIWMHVAGQPGSRWMTRDFLKYCFHYPFNELGVSRVSAYVEASNGPAHKLDAHIGFKPEARLKGVASDGGDVIIYAMTREDCRYVDV